MGLNHYFISFLLAKDIPVFFQTKLFLVLVWPNSQSRDAILIFARQIVNQEAHAQLINANSS